MSEKPTITDRLRHKQSMNPDHDEYRHEVLGRAADEITRLHAEAAELRARLASLDAELLRVRTNGHGAAHELDNISIECGLGHSPRPGDVAAHVRSLRADLSSAKAEVERVRGALKEAIKTCECRGTGTWTTSCTLCGDSTFDHYCNDENVPCDRPWCVAARAALAPTPPAQQTTGDAAKGGA